MKWFRLYHDVIDDPKIGLLPESEQLLWFKLLCLASMSDDRGSIAMNDDELCFRLRLSVEFWRCVKEKFRVKGLIECSKNGTVKICNWDKRQYDSDSSTERTQRYRNKQKSLKKKEGNVTETSQKRSCDALDTDTDSEEIRKEEITLVHSEQEPAQENPDFEHFQNARVSDAFLEQEEAAEGVCVALTEAEEVEEIAKPVQPELFDAAQSSDPEETPQTTAARPQKTRKAPKQNEFTDEAFDQFWKIVPLQRGKDPAKKKFKCITGISFTQFLASYEAAIAEFKTTAKQPLDWKYFRRPATWINQKGWQDESIAAFMPKQPAATSDETARLVAEVTNWAELMMKSGRAIAFRVDELGKVSIQLSSGKWANDQSMIQYCPAEKLRHEIQQREVTAA